MQAVSPSQSPADSSRLDVMNFLNEVAGTYPAAISFASGRPAEQFFDVATWLRDGARFLDHFAASRGMTVLDARNLLAQYGRTNGIIGDLIARQLCNDEAIACDERQILLTSGCQEAIELCVRTLCSEKDDVLLVRSPTYIGITGVADLNGIAIASFSSDDPEGTAGELARCVAAVRADGKRPRALYLVPEFDNPTGTVLGRQVREEIIAYCAANGIVILEDNPYGMFRFEGTPTPAMYSLDSHGCVIYLGTYSKTLCPALRIGFAVLPARLAESGLMDRLSQAKSFVTVNTSQVTQAIAGGILLANDCSLRRMVEPQTAHYRANRDAMLEALEEAFGHARGGVAWNRPQGGFFLTVELPRPFLQAQAERCARDYGVIVMPLSFFALDGRQDCRVRLAFSNAAPERIREGVAKFGRFVRECLTTD